MNLMMLVADLLGKSSEPEGKRLDAQGGELPVVSDGALKKADFITLPEDVSGTNCSSCEYQKDKVCQHPELKGQPVNQKNCCAYWDHPKALRSWKEKQDG